MSDLILKIRQYESLHIIFWLIKDTSWMMEWRMLGMIMIAPTLLIALYICIKTISEAEFFINLAVCFWIMANSYWMCCEFLGHAELKNYAGIPFALGFVSTGWFYLKKVLRAKEAKV